MKYLKQLLIILLISCIGELLNYLINLPIPSSIYGMIILFILLCLGVVKIHHIKEISKFLIDIMPILFIPYAVGIVDQMDQLKESWLQIIIITIVSTIITMVVTGTVSQAVINFMRRKNKNESDN